MSIRRRPARPLPLARTLLALSALVAGTGQAQSATVRGVAWDSVARAPLSRAVVQLLDPRDLSAPSVGRATTDSAGRFTMPGVPPGRWSVGFVHPRLDELGIEPPVRLVDVTAPESVVDVGIPAPSRVATSACGADVADTSGTLAGVVADAVTGAPARATVEIRWLQGALAREGLVQRHRVARVDVDNDAGQFVLCGLPAGEELTVLASRGADSSGLVAVVTNARRLVRRDLWLAPASAAPVRLAGRVITDRDDSPLANVQVTVLGTSARAASDAAGEWALDAPLGTRTIEFRAIGYAPLRQVVDFARDAALRVDVRLTAIRVALDTVRVRASRGSRLFGNGFERRRGGVPGHYFDEATVAQAATTQLSHLLVRVPWMRVVEENGFLGLRVRGEEAVCAPVVFLDGVRVPIADLRELDLLMHPRDLGLMEVFTHTLAPREFSNLEGCGVIALWTRQRLPASRGRR